MVLIYQWQRKCDFKKYKKIYRGSKTSKTCHINKIYLKMKMDFGAAVEGYPKVIYLILLYILTLYLRNTILQH